MVDAIIALIGGLGAFLIGFKILSENIEKLTNTGLRKLFNKTNKNKFVGVGIGALVTAVIQSSSATTVMVVGFVNAGILSLYQATAMIMGANIGTTITAQIASLESIDITGYAVALAGIGIFMDMLCKKEKTKTIGLSLAGLGLVFLGLGFMSDSMKGFRDNEAVLNALQVITNPFLLLIIGAGFTALVQSSSAVTTIVITMVAGGLVIGNGGNCVLYVILGTNIGTCITALLSSIGASTNARRASLIHLMFNLFGSLIFTFVLLIWKDFMNDTLVVWFKNSATQIAMFHTLFNVVCTLLFIPFISVFVKLSQLIIKDKKDSLTSTTFMDERILKTPSVALNQMMKETARLGEIAFEALSLSIDGFVEKSLKNEQTIYQRLEELEILNKSIIGYLIKLSSLVNTSEEEKIISNLHHSLGDFLRQAEIADNIIKYTKIEIKDSLDFSDKVYAAINLMKEKLSILFDKTKNIFLTFDFSELDEIDVIEEEIDNMRTDLINDHIRRLEEGKCKPQNSNVYINLISNLERAGDHLTYIAHSIAEK